MVNSDQDEELRMWHACKTSDGSPYLELAKRIEVLEAAIQAEMIAKAEATGAAREIAREVSKQATLKAAAISAIASLLVGAISLLLNRAFATQPRTPQVQSIDVKAR
jgi:hypothetical protein